MKNSRGRGDRGMTLLEVLLACVLLPVIIFGATSLLMSLARVSDKTNAGMDFLMKIDTVFLRLEENLLNITATDPYPQVVWNGSNSIDLQLSGAPDPSSYYRYTFATRVLLKHAADGSETTFSTGVLLPDAPLDDYDKNGAIDAADIARRDNCLATPSEGNCHTAGVPFVFGVASDQNRLDFSFRSERQQENAQHGFTKSIPLAK